MKNYNVTMIKTLQTEILFCRIEKGIFTVYWETSTNIFFNSSNSSNFNASEMDLIPSVNHKSDDTPPARSANYSPSIIKWVFHFVVQWMRIWFIRIWIFLEILSELSWSKFVYWSWDVISVYVNDLNLISRMGQKLINTFMWTPNFHGHKLSKLKSFPLNGHGHVYRFPTNSVLTQKSPKVLK
jgi:hypothetical protein